MHLPYVRGMYKIFGSFCIIPIDRRQFTRSTTATVGGEKAEEDGEKNCKEGVRVTQLC